MDLRNYHAALSMPIAPYTRELRTELHSADEETERLAFEWNRPVRVLGFFGTLESPAEPGEGLVLPTLASILCCVDVEDRIMHTKRVQVPGDGASGNYFVTLPALIVPTIRAVDIRIDAPSPSLGVRFRWRQGPDFYETTHLALACFWDYLSPELSEN